MSATSDSQGSIPSSTASPHSTAERLFERLFSDPALCVVCFARKRTFYPEYDEALAERLYRGPSNGRRGSNKLAFHAMGHSVDEEGGIQVNSATSDADPATYQEVVPPKTDKYGQILEPASPKTICECGVIDYNCDEDHRTKAQLYDAIENMAEHISDGEDGRAFDLDAAREVVRQATKRDDLAGHDQTVLVGAIEFGLKKADG